MFVIHILLSESEYDLPLQCMGLCLLLTSCIIHSQNKLLELRNTMHFVLGKPLLFNIEIIYCFSSLRTPTLTAHILICSAGLKLPVYTHRRTCAGSTDTQTEGEDERQVEDESTAQVFWLEVNMHPTCTL